MSRRFRIKKWEAAWLFTSGFILLLLLAPAVYDHAAQFKRAVDQREEIASAFEHPACERFTRMPVTELPEAAEVEKPCRWVVFERRLAHEFNWSTQITAADVRAWPLLWPSWIRIREQWDLVLLTLALLPTLYGIGLLAESAAMRRRRATSSPGTDGHP